MKSNNSWRIRLAQILLGAAIVIALVVVRGAKAGDEPVHLVTDWSHRHVVFSNPTSLIRRFQLSSDPRYREQWVRRNAERRGDRDEWRWRRAPEDPAHLHGDWSVDMGSGATVGAGNYPAKFSFDSTSAYCANPTPPAGQQPDFVVYNTSLAGTSSQATIVAFDNLYSSCNGGTYPTTYWAYNTGTTGAVLTSPVLSADGTQVAFIQNATSTATLVILRWAADDGTLLIPVAPTAEIPTSYNNGSGTLCTAPCMTTITFSSSNSDAGTADDFSSPFYDYTNDVLYVGDNDGFLHKFTGIFRGTPAELVCTSSTAPAGCTAPAGTDLWPANLAAPFSLNSPVLGEGENRILVTDRVGFFYSVDPAVGGVFSGSIPAAGNFIFSEKLASTGFDDGPLLDVTTGDAYLFARGDCTGVSCANPAVAAVIQVPLSTFADNATIGTDGITEAVVSSTTLPATALYNGTFDNAYYTSAGGTGKLYTCGVSGGFNVLYQISITTGTMNTTAALGPTLTNANVACSPITEFENGATDRMFLSVTGSAETNATINCPSNTGCIMSFNITSPTWNSSTKTSATTSVTSGTSAIIIDNSSSAGGASQVYFTPLANQSCATAVTGGYAAGTTGGCAIQASQSALGE